MSESEDPDDDEVQRCALRRYEEASETELRTIRGLLVEQARATIAQLRREEQARHATPDVAPPLASAPAHYEDDDDDEGDDDEGDDDEGDADDDDDDDDNDDDCLSEAGSVIHVACVASAAARQANPDQGEDQNALRIQHTRRDSLDKALVRRPIRQRSSTPWGDGNDGTSDKENRGRSDSSRSPESAESNLYDLCEFTTWYLVNMSGNTADCFFGGQRIRNGGYSVARENHYNDFDIDDVIDGQPLPECVQNLFSGVYYHHPYVPLAKLVAYEIGSLSTSLNWMRQVQLQSVEDDQFLEAAFKQLAKYQTVDGFWRFVDKITYPIVRHSKSRHSQNLNSSSRREPLTLGKRRRPLQEQAPSRKKRPKLFDRPS